MKNKTKDNTYGLKEHAKKRNQITLEKVDKAIQRIKRSRTKKINFKTVAEEAGVSIATLYNNAQIRERIEGLRALEQAMKSNLEENDVKPPQLKKEKIKTMHEEIRKLKEDKKNLIIQLVEIEELKAENKRLRDQLEKIISVNK